ncbi:transcription termination factor NusA [Bacteroidales bacterium OttesenSCG-928-K03]|nr:transcription termination factor NusA [Odoribacter sp. OttesenSCG-928-L07]MDL2239437.1 transcription termination factor NusA [Bacteroidales bacterium OttesenSCG-928-L14]MDL2240558.1 transcription termination factor NusA [Bacteroidales bacterium OttesenSCG-928-K22]MDL2242660.1 transcription termination factor NusA [Bacteroidales bacterium OttesenSCG-928-K03]
MESINLVESFSEFQEFKNIDRTTMMRILEDVFRSMLVKKYGTDENIDVIVNVNRGDFEIWRTRLIVEDNEVEDPNLQIAYSEAINTEPDYEVGEDFVESISISHFGRRDILAIRQSLSAKVQEYEKNSIYKKYVDKVGEIVTGEVYQVWKREMLILDDEGIELILPKTEQIPEDYYHKGDIIRAVVSRVELRNNIPYIILSRTSPVFLERLFEAEVPEVFDGLITIKKIVRIPGKRAKIAVESYDDRIDPVGACVGMKGSRIHVIVRELKSENIDVVNYTNNPTLFITRALSPAKISSVVLHNDTKKADVYMDPDQVYYAIGKNGYNIKLASKLTGYDIDVYRESDVDDVNLDLFTDEIEPWIIDVLKGIGCDTARSVMELNFDDLMKRTDLEEETLRDVLKILEAEFEE